MSAIAGLLRFDGRPVARHELERAAGALRQYGPDRSDICANGNLGLAHVLMRITPEDAFDRQPLRGPSGAVISADLRLDNRDDLVARLGVEQQATAWPDARVLLAAWEKFGEDVWPMLRGPFAAAIWDPRRRALTLARDHLGLNVVMWHRGAQFFAFATMPNGLFALGAPRELSEEKLADFLVLNHAEQATTLYRDVFRVRPAHVMQITADGIITERRFWSPDDAKPVRLASDQDYADGLREVLDRAVRRQMRSAHPIGCLLSGGLDSSSVSALAARALSESNRRLDTFTGVPRRGFSGEIPAGHYADERAYVDSIAAKAGNIDVSYVHNDEHDDFGELERFFAALDGPVRNPGNLGWVLGALRLARERGHRVLLGGLIGNATISWNGWSQAAGHLAGGRFITAYRQWRLFYRLTSHSRWGAARKLFVEQLRPQPASASWLKHAAIRPDFAAAMQVDARAKNNGHDFSYRSRPGERISALKQVDYAGDWFAAEKAVTGVEVRDPTADIDLVSYCFGIPPEQYLAEGIDRSLIRRAMWGLLPEPVLTNRTSGMQAADWYEKLDSRRGELRRQIDDLAASPLARRVIDVPRLRRAVDNWPSGGWHRSEVFAEYNLALTRGIAGGRFLRWFERANS
jgi:asparagine synthase (glutamine-hydrolysing)